MDVLTHRMPATRDGRARSGRCCRALLVICMLVAPAFAGPAAASPIRYTFTYTALDLPNVVPGFSFSFELGDYVTTTGMFALPSAFTIPTGGAPGSNTITHAGTNNTGDWVFGNASESISDCCSFLSFLDGAAIRFAGAAPAGYVMAPGVVSFVLAGGATEAIPGQWTYVGSGSLLVEDLAQVPEPASLMMFGLGLCAVAGWRKHRRVGG